MSALRQLYDVMYIVHGVVLRAAILFILFYLGRVNKKIAVATDSSLAI